MHRIFLLLGCAGCLLPLACSNSSSGGGGGGGGDAGGCVAYVSSVDLTTPTVSFQTDVLPIFEQSCGIGGGTCHGIASEAVLLRPFLGVFDDDASTDSAAIVNGIVGVASNEDPQMDLVKAGDPSQSYMMHKLDGDQCTLETDCAPAESTIVAASNPTYTGCGTLMPQSPEVLLPQAKRDTVRRWIAQGASNN
jgi:hypothetical protein